MKYFYHTRLATEDPSALKELGLDRLIGYYTAHDNKQPTLAQNGEVVMFLSDRHCYSKEWAVVLYGERCYFTRKEFLMKVEHNEF